jgi:hypothetical protein
LRQSASQFRALGKRGAIIFRFRLEFKKMIASKSGSCLCGGVRYEVSGPLRPVVACHCTQCRKTSGHYVAATQAPEAKITMHGDTLRWFRSSEQAERGFCGVCGSNLFWRRFGSDKISGPTGLRMESQIHSESKGDYYDLPDAPDIDQSSLS